MKQRILAVLTAIVLLPLPGCGITQKERRGATLELDMSKSYACETFDFRGGDISPLSTVDCGLIVGKFPTRGEPKYYLYNTQTDEFTEFPREHKEYAVYTGQLPDGRYIFLFNDSVGRKNGGDVSDGIHRSAEIFDKDLKLAERFSLPEEMPIGVLSVQTLQMDKDGNWLFYSDNSVSLNLEDTEADSWDEWEAAYYVLNPDFTVKGKLDYDGYQANDLAVGKSGMIYGVTDSRGSASRTLYRFDCEHVTAESVEGVIPSDVRVLMDGSDDAELYYSVTDGIYTLREDGTSEFFVDYLNSDLPDGVTDSFLMADGSFLVDAYDEDAGTFSYVRLRPRTEEEIAQIKQISLAGVSINHRLVKDVTTYNRSQSEYRIVMKDYGREWAQNADDPEIIQELRVASGEWRNAYLDFTPAVETFKNDLLSGIVPDIICMEEMPYQVISNKGLLTDLMPLLTADARFDETKYLHNILGGLKRGERLERIGFSFRLNTMAAKTEFVGEKQWHTADEYLAMLQNVPDGMQYLPQNTRESMIETYLVDAQGTFIDKANMTCRFDSPAFVSLLELVNAVKPFEDQFSSEKEFYTGMEYGYNFRQNHTLLCPISLARPIEYHGIHFQDFGKEDITLVGYPESAGGNGGMYKMDYTIALTAQSDREAPVMDFITTQLGSKHQARLCVESWNSASLPVMREMVDNALLGAGRGYHSGGNLTVEEQAVLRDYIENVKMYQDVDPSVTAVIYEEAGKYFAGDCTAQDAAKTIQSRISIYLAEQQ